MPAFLLGRYDFDTFDKNGTGYGTAFGMQLQPQRYLHPCECKRNPVLQGGEDVKRYGQRVNDSVNLSNIGLFANPSTPVSEKARVFVKPGVGDTRAHSFGFNNEDCARLSSPSAPAPSMRGIRMPTSFSPSAA